MHQYADGMQMLFKKISDLVRDHVSDAAPYVKVNDASKAYLVPGCRIPRVSPDSELVWRLPLLPCSPVPPGAPSVQYYANVK